MQQDCRLKVYSQWNADGIDFNEFIKYSKLWMS